MSESVIPFNVPSYLNDSAVTQALKDYLQGISAPESADQMLNDLFGSNAFLTKSCTNSLEIIAKLIGFSEEDEVIMPSFAFPSMANAFLAAGANLVFADSKEDHPNIDPLAIEKLITKRTKALVIVHYGGSSCDFEAIMPLVRKYNLTLVEDAAHCIGTYRPNQHLGTIGDFGAISFHSTKNLGCEEGGMLLINELKDKSFIDSLLDKGTNQREFLDGIVNSYQWVSLGSAHRLPSLLSALLLPQLKNLEALTNERRQLWENYYEGLSTLDQKGMIRLSAKPKWHNGHIFHLIVESRNVRASLMTYLKKKGITTTFHYQSLSESSMAQELGLDQVLFNAHRYQEQLLRVPIYHGMTWKEQSRVINAICDFYDTPG
jgi:dTDP-4-amino-4,6-dideoxygalactose transaminase